MALAINIEDLLKKQKIESNRIEFKKGWNPASIYHSVCAFANDFDDLGGGYILVGGDSDDDTGLAIRPVEGSPISSPISSPNTAHAIIAMIKENPYISTSMMAGKLGISKRAVIKHTNQLQLDGEIKRNGSARSGSWEIVC